LDIHISSINSTANIVKMQAKYSTGISGMLWKTIVNIGITSFYFPAPVLS